MRTKALVVGIAGEAGSGKDTVCDHLVAEHGFQKVSLATPLKQIVGKVFPKFTEESLYGPSHLRNQTHPDYKLSGDCPICSKKMQVVDSGTGILLVCRCGFSHGPNLDPRLALQSLGTDWGRRLYPDVWVDYLFSEIDIENPNQAFCISDVRFANEVGAIIKNGGFVIRLKRKKPMDPNHKRNPTMKTIFGRLFGKLLGKPNRKVHASESGLDDIPDSVFKSVIENDSTLPVLYGRVDKAIEDIL